jgi:peptide/nickel transport system permease protein
MIPTLLGISFLTFALMHLAPGDPAEVRFAGSGADAQSQAAGVAGAIERFRAEHLLDQPLWKQYLHYLGPFDLSARGQRWFGGSGERPFGGLLTLDLEHELLRPEVSIRAELGRRLAVTVPFMLLAVLLSYAIAVPLALLAVLRRGSALDVGATVCVFLLYAAPTFWVGLLLQLAFGASGLGWLPVLGLADKEAADLGTFASWVDVARHALLPLVCLTYGGFAYLSRQMRSGMLEVMREDYIRTARAKGLGERAVVLRHALRNSLVPVVTLFASVLPTLIGGSVVVEYLFDIPGMGRYAFEGLLQRDYSVVMATTTLSAVLTLVGVLVSDVLCAWLDPRIRYE